MVRIIFIVATTLIFASHTLQQDQAFLEAYNNYKKECSEQYGLTMEYVTVDINSMKTLPDDNNDLKCYFLCLNMKLGVQDSKGDIDDDALEKVTDEFFNVTLSDKIGNICDIKPEADPCETAFDSMQCILNFQNGAQ